MHNRKYRILVVDDEADITKEIAAVLKRSGDFEVMTFFTGREAVQYFEKNGADIVLLDILMPGMDGYAVLKEIKSSRQDNEVLMVTAVNDAKSALKAVNEFGANDYLTKPFQMEELLHRVKLAVGRLEAVRNGDLTIRLLELVTYLGRRDPEKATEIWERVKEIRSTKKERGGDISPFEFKAIYEEVSGEKVDG